MHEQVYSWLVRLYPERFREDYADEALQLFRDRLQNERGPALRLRLWFDIVRDLGTSLWREHRAEALDGPAPAANRRYAANAPYLHLIKDGLSFRHLFIGAISSVAVYAAVLFAVSGEGSAIGPELTAARGSGFSARGAQNAPEFGRQPSDQAGVSIQGIVRVAQTGEPVADAWIAVARMESDGARPAGTPATPPIPDAETDAAGRFEIRHLAAGPYRLIVMAGGYVRQEYSQTITVEAGQPARNVAIHLVPAAGVSGRIQDTAGRPLAGVSVTLLRRAYSANGDLTLRQVMTKSSNDLGEYRFYWVTPGRYVVAAQSSVGGVFQNDPVSAFEQAVSRGINEVDENYLRQFFPGFPEEEKASTIEVLPGVEIRGINMTLISARVFRVRGRVVDALTGQPPAQMSISGMGGTRYFQNARTGTFEYLNVLPGTYGLTASASVDLVIGLLNADPTQPRARATVVVTDADVENVVLSISPSRVVRGSIRVDGAIESSSQVGRVRFSLVPQSRPPGGSGAIAVSTNADGTFVFDGTADGMFRVSMPNLPDGLYLKEARLDGVDILNDFAKIAAAEKLELLISSKSGVIEGVVRDEGGNPRSGVQAVLVPSQRHRTDLFKRAVSDPNGRFSIAGIPPGDYRAFAWAGLEDYAYFDPAVLDAYEAQGRVVRIGESSRQTMELKVIGALP